MKYSKILMNPNLKKVPKLVYMIKNYHYVVFVAL